MFNVMQGHQIDMNPEPIIPNFSRAIFFENETHIGFDPSTNEPIYWGSRAMAEFDYQKDEKGKQVWRKHATTGVDMVKVREHLGNKDESFIYKKVTDGRGNIYREDCEHPSVLEKRVKDQQDLEAAEARGFELVRELGTAGVTAAQVQEFLAAKNAPPPPPVKPVKVTASGTVVELSAAEPGPSPQPKPSIDPAAEHMAALDKDAQELRELENGSDEEYPQMYASGLYYLSPLHEEAVKAAEEEAFKGTKEAAKMARKDWLAERAKAQAAMTSTPTF